MDLRVAAVTLALGVAVAPGAYAQHGRTAQPAAQQNLLELGRRQFDDLRYEEAIQTLSAALIRRGNTPQAEIQIYELLALSYLALHRTDEAEGAYRLLLARDPTHQLSNDLAPQTLEFFAGVRQRWESEGRPGLPQQQTATATPAPAAPPAPVAIEHHSPAEQQHNHAVPLTATVSDPGHRVARIVLAYRTGSQGLFHRLDASNQGGGTYAVTIPADAVRPPLVEYYLEAVNGAGVPVQSRGDAFAPLRVAVPQSGGIPWWVFAGGGALVIAAGVIVYAVVASQTAQSTLIVQVHGM